MAQAFAAIDVEASADQVWRLIGGFGSLPDWLPFIPRSELSEGGRVRRLATSDGATIVERLMAFDHAAWSYTYAIVEAPFPVVDYVSTLRVEELRQGGGARVEWSGRFTPRGIGERDVVRLFQKIYEDGLEALAAKLATTADST